MEADGRMGSTVAHRLSMLSSFYRYYRVFTNRRGEPVRPESISQLSDRRHGFTMATAVRRRPPDLPRYCVDDDHLGHASRARSAAQAVNTPASTWSHRRRGGSGDRTWSCRNGSATPVRVPATRARRGGSRRRGRRPRWCGHSTRSKSARRGMSSVPTRSTNATGSPVGHEIDRGHPETGVAGHRGDEGVDVAEGVAHVHDRALDRVRVAALASGSAG